MRLVRAFPSRPRPGRSHIVDDAQRITVDDYNYAELLDVGDDVISLDWDIAVSRQDLAAFAEQARREPDRVIVAPYPIYPDTRPGLPGVTWPFRRFAADGQSMRYVREGEPTCHLFGFGMVYLPRHLLGGFSATHPALNLDDNTFSQWHYLNVAREVPIAWHIRPVHLNYTISSVLPGR